MNIHEQIQDYIASLPEPKRSEFEELHLRILKSMPKCKQWFLDGKDEYGKTVSNPNIGYGSQVMTHSGGKTREFYQVGLSSNTTGISVYIMGLKDKEYLSKNYGKKLGKASVTGYCIKFKRLKDMNVDVLMEAIRDGVKQTGK